MIFEARKRCRSRNTKSFRSGYGVRRFVPRTIEATMKRALAVVIAFTVVALVQARTVEQLPDSIATFSILGFDPATGEIGGAVQSRVFSVGNGVLWAEAGVGAAATQAVVDVSYGPQALALLRNGVPPNQVIKQVWQSDSDPRPIDWSKEGRQFAVIDAKGAVAAFTGPKASAWAGHKACSAA